MIKPSLKDFSSIKNIGILRQRFFVLSSKTVLTVLFLFFIFPKETFSQNKVKTIVIFFSFNEAVPAYQSILEGFHTAFPQYYHEPFNLLIEYLDVGRDTGNDYPKHIVKLYNEKFVGTRLDLIITVGPGTYQLLKKEGLNALNTTPVIEIELDNGQAVYQYDTLKKNVFEIKLKIEIGKTLKNALKLFPNNRNVYVISGSSPTDQYYHALTRKAAQVFAGEYRFTYISGISLDSTLKLVKKIPVKSIVVIPSYMTDVNNAPISTTYALNIIAGQCRAPLFTVTDNFIKKGGIGGCILSFAEIGKETGRVSGQILKGKQLKTIILNQENFYQNIYDWKELKRWNLLKSEAIPVGSIFINKDFDFFSEYRWHILVLFLFVISQTLLLFYLFRTNKRQKEFMNQKAEYEKLNRQLIREERLMRMAELTASLSHELNQPLTAILYSAQAGNRFLESGKLDTTRANEIFDNIIEDDKRAASILSGLRSMMKSETREKETINLQEIIQDTINIYHSEAVQQNIQVRYGQPAKPVMVSGDRIQLQQVVLNLLSNAARAMENSIPEKKITEIRQEVNHGSVTVSVRDYGTGISAEIKDKLFKPFITTHKGGLGIGLSISRSIIEGHGGEIRAANKEGGGAEFSFTLKLAENE